MSTKVKNGKDPAEFQCKVASSKLYDPAIRNRMNMMSHNKYFYKLMIDDLPSATMISPKKNPDENIREYIESERFELVGFNKDIVYTEGL